MYRRKRYESLLEWKKASRGRSALLVEGDGDVSAAHPRVQSAYAMLEVLAERGAQPFRFTARRYAQKALELLDPVRDAEELAALREQL